MSDILCKWLNQELRLSKAVERETLAKDFSSGYLIGEVLYKYQLQNDFSMFLKKDTSIAKVNNFTRLQPTLQLLGISFNINTAQDLMQEKQGVATHLLYQLYISLEKMKKAEITGTMMAITQPAARATLRKKEHEIFCDRLHQVVKRDADLKLPKISQHYGEKCQQSNDRSVLIHPVQHKRQVVVQNENRMKNTQKLGVFQQKRNDLTTSIPVPKPPPYSSQLNLKKREQQRQEREALFVQSDIEQFEANRKKLVASSFSSSSSGQPFPADVPLGGNTQGCEIPGSGTKLILQSNSKYIQEIRQRLKENAVSCEQREKRLHRFLEEQFKAREAEEEARRDEQLVKRLTRQSKEEKRLVAQLLQIRMEKEVIRENRLFREQQYQQRREKDIQEAQYREAVLAQQAKLVREEDIRQELEYCDRIAAERAQSRHKEHSKSCKDILEQIVDLATKVGEYRLLTGNVAPEKQMREWKELLFNGLPLYEPIKSHQPEFEFSTPLEPVELQKQEILNNLDYDEYTNMVGEWAWPEEAGETKLPPTNNNILGHVVQRLRNTVHPPIMEPSSHSFPHFTIMACVLGKLCAGKTTCLAKIAEAHGICVIVVGTLIEEAMNAYKNGERSTRAIQGAAAEKELRKGNGVPYELEVDILVEAIKQVPAQSGWILDGFPRNVTQAYLLEKALGGCVDEGHEVVSSRRNLAADPNPPKPPPAPAPVLDLALLLDVPNECAVRRAYSHMDTDSAGDAATTSQSTDKSLYLAQISHRIPAFQDTWPELVKWFGGKQNILVRVDADVDCEELYSSVESILQRVILEKQKALASPCVKDEAQDSAKAPDSSSSTTPLPVDHPSALTNEALGPTESYSSLKEGKAQSVSSLSKSNVHSPRGHSRNMSVSSVSNEDSQAVTKSLTESASSCQRSVSQDYVDECLPSDIPEYLCSYWDTVCESYVNNVKTVMQELRSQRTFVNNLLFTIREGYKHYLGRPDLKQELVSQWQKDFNGIPDDMREDEDTKAELHLRLDELCERLWDIIDKHKEENEKERASLMSYGWLEDHTVILINHHSILMQAVVNRFQETLCVLRVYYLSMYRQILPEPPSNLISIPLLDPPGIETQNESYPPGASEWHQMDDGEDKRKIKFTPLPRYLNSSQQASKMEDQDQTELDKQLHEKLISDCEETLTAISRLVSAEVHQMENKELKENLQEKKKDENEKEKDKKKASASASKIKKERLSSKKQKGLPSPQPAPSPVPADEKNSETTQGQEVRKKIRKEYGAALNHEENAAKARIELVKGHGLVMVHSLQSRAEQTFSSMKEWLEARYLAERKSIDQLSEVVRHHIEAAAKLQYQLVLEDSDFFLNGDCLMVANPAPPPRPPPLEKPTGSTPTIAQLKSLHHQLCSIAPSGLMSRFEFSDFLKDIISVNMFRNTLPQPWIHQNETQLMEIVSLLTDDNELVDWRQFLLSAALPWPFPSLTQLLDVLQHFKAADTGDTGYINEDQYLQTEVWFSTESVQTVPDDPSEPVPYDRLSNLRKFFFQLFADHSSSPPRLDYVSMLLYFAADPNPRQGFIRALCVVLGQHLKDSSLGHLVKSMPSIEDATELSSPELHGHYKEEETLCASSSLFEDQEVSIPALLAVMCHKVTKIKDNSCPLPDCPSQEEHTEHLVQIFRQLGYRPEDRVPFSILTQHPDTEVLMENSTQYQLVNIHRVLMAHQDEGQANSLTVS